MKKWILRTLIVLLVTGLVAGGIYLLVNKASANLPVGMELRGEGRPDGGEGHTDGLGEARPDGGRELPAGLARPEGRHGGRDGSGAFGLARSLLIVAGAVALVALITFAARHLRRKPQPAAPCDVPPLEAPPPAE